MKKILLSIACLCLFPVLFVHVSAQEVYPVRLYTALYPPYTPEVASFYTGTQEKLVVTLVNTDLNQPMVRIRLRMKITGTLLSLYNPPEVYTPEISLESGMPVRLSLHDFAIYFRKESLRINGNPSEFYRTGRLPDGFYRFHFEAYDVQTGRLVSNREAGFAQAWIVSVHPPLLNLPRKGELVAETDLQQILFSWTPRHTNSMYAAYNTEYEFSIAEIYDKSLPPEAAFTYSPVLYSEHTLQSSVLYTLMQPALIPGRRYAWQVKAIARDGTEAANVFLNDGYSQVFWFDYTADCKPVTEISASYDAGRVYLTWTETPASDYRLEYRRTGESEWTSENIYAGTHVLSSLQPGEKYEYRIACRCVDNDGYVYSEIRFFEVPEKIPQNPACGIQAENTISNRKKISNLSAGDVVSAGKFPVKITEVKGSSNFTGEGQVMIPVLKKSFGKVIFKQITVNTDRQLLSGYFETAYDPADHANSVWNIDDYIQGGAGMGDIRTGEEKAAYTVTGNIDVNHQAGVEQKTGRRDDEENQEHPENDTDTETGAYYVISYKDKQGKNHKIEVDELPATVSDTTGSAYEIDEDGNITVLYEKASYSLKPETRDILREDLAVIVFEKTPRTLYTLDVYKEAYLKETLFFEAYKKADEQIYSSCKFMPEGKTDELFIRIISSGKNFKPEKVHFITTAGKELKSTYEENRNGWTLRLLGSEAGDGQELYVVQDETGKGKYATLGKLRIHTYESKILQVRLVPVNGFRLDEKEIRASLNAIYNPVGISFVVKTEDNFVHSGWDLNADGKLQVEGSGLISSQTDEMKILNRFYEAMKEQGLEKDAVYLFMLKSANLPDLAGCMPRGKQFGYLFGGATGRIAAHEIGHGAFKLRHLSEYHFTQGDLPDNLMNTPPGVELAKFQWDAVHSPGFVSGIFEKDEDGMSIIENNRLMAEFLENLRLSIRDGKNLQVVTGANTTEKGGMLLDGRQYSFLSATYNKNANYTLKGIQPSVFNERTIYGKEVFCLGYAGNSIKITLHSNSDREYLKDYLHASRANVFLLFVSGYDPMDEIKEFLNANENQQIYENFWDKLVGFVQKTPMDKDRKQYWSSGSFSDRMIHLLKPKYITYMAGHDDVGTSNHRSIGKFATSLLSSLSASNLLNACYHRSSCVYLNTETNTNGFIQRRNNGFERGKDFVSEIKSKCSRTQSGILEDTLDVVCHSMGFAHALGIVDAVKQSMQNDLKGLTLGRFYIFAPENACSGEVNPNEWKEIWQYGSSEEALKNHPWLQDGVAPQCAVKNIGNRRIFIPSGYQHQGFLESHSIGNYGWVFELGEGSKGRVVPRS